MCAGVTALKSVIQARIMCSAVLENYYKPQAVLRDVKAHNAFMK